MKSFLCVAIIVLLAAQSASAAWLACWTFQSYESSQKYYLSRSRSQIGSTYGKICAMHSPTNRLVSNMACIQSNINHFNSQYAAASRDLATGEQQYRALSSQVSRALTQAQKVPKADSCAFKQEMLFHLISKQF
ncbi:uncharacterized protein LOC143473190 [Clavelina lepadiformis]|uniref:Uncharacterized protein n=1 Tax=Clavelina lepadiformis TaxID=159417 RepID=A0ABP0FXJ2_CLALP